MPSPEHEIQFDLFGSSVRLLIGAPARADLPPAELAAVQAEVFLRLLHRKLTRFDPDSELCRLNADPRDEVPVSSVLAAAVRAGVAAAEQTGGLVDPTLVGELERSGYARSRVGLRPAPLREALAAAPERAPAAPHPDRGWRDVSVDLKQSVVTRPPGLRLDTGGTGKGLAADLASARLDGYEMHVVDAGGDLRIGGTMPAERLVEVEHPLRREPAVGFGLEAGAVATSGLKTRIWRQDGGFSHHLLDPATGKPAWTGVIQATAIADTALRAEALAKTAVLLGPDGGRGILREGGGVLILDDGTVEVLGGVGEQRPELIGSAA